MANNYSDTSVTFVSRDSKQPFALGPIGTAAIKSMTAWYDSDSGTAFIDDNGPQVESIVANACLEASGIDHAVLGTDRTTQPCFGEVMTAIHKAKPEMVTADMLAAVNDRFGFTEEAEWESVYLEDVMRALVIEPGANCVGAIEETSWQCDRNRHGEFGGGAFGYTDLVSRGVSSASVVEETLYADRLLRDIDTALTPVVEFYTARTREVFREIRNEDHRKLVQDLVVANLSK